MKVLFHAYNTCCQNEAGGVQVRMRRIHDLLIENSIHVDYFSPFETKIRDYDVLHVFSLNLESLALMKVAKDCGKLIVLSSIVNILGGWKIDLYRKFLGKLPIITTYKLLYETIHLADVIIAETEQERQFIHRHYLIELNKIVVIPNGVDLDSYEGKEIYDRIPGLQKYVLQVGRFDDNKNQLNVIKALKGTDIDVVFIGGEDSRGGVYYEKCKREAGNDNHFHFLGWLHKDDLLLKSAYHWADTLVLPSHYETFGLVAIEAGVQGVKLVLSETLPICDYNCMRGVQTLCPDNIDSIKKSIIYTYNQQRTETLKKEIMKEFSWEKIIAQHIKVYNRLI